MAFRTSSAVIVIAFAGSPPGYTTTVPWFGGGLGAEVVGDPNVALWSTATPWGWFRPPFGHPELGDCGIPSGESSDIELPPKLANQTEPSSAIAVPHAAPVIPPPLIGLPTGFSAVVSLLAVVVPGSQLLPDQTSPFASIATRPDAYRSDSV